MTDALARLEPRTRAAGLEPGLAARTADPLWLLARQWALGELTGDDAATPTAVDLEVDVHRLTELHLPDGSVVAHDPALTPLDALVEAEPARAPRRTARTRVDVGRALVQALRGQGLPALAAAVAAAYPLEPADEALRLRDPAGARLLDVAAGRLPDGGALLEEVGAAGDTLQRLTVAAADAGPLADALDDWRRWLAGTVSEPAGGATVAWQPERLEHRFAVRTPSRTGLLSAPEHRGGDLDWHAFVATAGPAATEPAQQLRARAVPTPLSFRGMPNPRYWELEDASIDLGSVDAPPSDTARLALLEFAFAFGNDVFALPLRLPRGSLSVVTSLTIANTFGERIAATQALRAPTSTDGGWAMFALEGDGGTRVPGLLLPHAASHALRGPVLEEAGLLRDEMANLGWGVERRVEGEAGRPIVRAEEEGQLAPPTPPPAQGDPLVYRVQSSVPPSWFPLVTVAGAPGAPRLLELQTLAPSVEAPRGTLLPGLGARIHEEELPREGVRLVRAFALARWTDGSTHVWARRQRGTGRGEGSSGLRFDAAEPET